MTITHYQSHRITLLILACLFFLINNLSAQQKFSVSLTGGPSFPVGRFSDQVNTMPTGLVNVDGGAQTGWNGNLELGAAITPHTWASITVGLSGFKRSNQSFEEYLQLIYGNTAVADAGSWKVLKVLAGPSFRLPFGKKLTIRPAASAGIAKTAIPAYSYSTYNQGGNPLMAVTQTKISMPATFAYQLGLGFGYKLTKQLSFLADFDFFGARAKYEFTPFSPGGSAPSRKYEYALNNYSISAGVEFAF